MPTINGLTANQVALLDEMWACESMEELEQFLDTLDRSDYADAMQLQRILLIEMLDEEMANQTQYPEANKVINQFRLTK
jgi:hypothetical protein